MPNTDIDGSPILILSLEDAQVLANYYAEYSEEDHATMFLLTELSVFKKIQTFVNKWKKVNEN
jgi:hypothetical protein